MYYYLLWTFHDGEHERKYVAIHGITKAINVQTLLPWLLWIVALPVVLYF